MNPSHKKRTIEEIVTALRTFVPEENIHYEPEHATGVIVQMEAKYRLNTVDFLAASHGVAIDEEDSFTWLNEYDSFLQFDGKAELINTQGKQVEK